MGAATAEAFDPARRYVRRRGERANGFVEFEFAIGEPALFVEMILAKDAFAEFCAAHAVKMLPPQHGDGGSAPSDWDWRLADATQHRFK